MSNEPAWKPRWGIATLVGAGTHSLSTNGNPVRAAWRRCPALTGYTHQFKNALTKTFLGIVIVLTITGGALSWCQPVWGAENRPEPQPLTPGSPLNFDKSVKIAIHQSPNFIKSSLDIELKRLDETDSRYGMIPPLTFITYYYVTRPENSSVPYSLNFSTDPYNPLGSYFSLQAQKVGTQIAILTHLIVISKYLQQMGEIYLNLDALKKLEASQKDTINLLREILKYVESSASMGTATTIDVKLAEQNLQVAQAEQEQIVLIRKQSLSALRDLLGLKPGQELNVDTRDSRRQVLGNFDPATATLEQAQGRSYRLKIAELYKELQGYNISLSISKVFPTATYTLSNPSPLSNVNNGIFVGIGLQVPVWDGFTRIRNVSRQKIILKQIESQKQGQVSELEKKWSDALVDIHEKESKLKIKQSQVELARLKARQIEINYQSGEVILPELLNARINLLKSQMETVRAVLDYDKAVLTLRENSGDLAYTYVDANSWQK